MSWVPRWPRKERVVSSCRNRDPGKRCLVRVQAGEGEDCTALTSGTCLMDEHITILIINPYYDFRSVQLSPYTFPIHRISYSTRQPDMAVRYALKKSATYLYYKRRPYKIVPLVQSWVPPRRTVTFWRSFRTLASDSASYKRFAFLRWSPPSVLYPC